MRKYNIYVEDFLGCLHYFLGTSCLSSTNPRRNSIHWRQLSHRGPCVDKLKDVKNRIVVAPSQDFPWFEDRRPEPDLVRLSSPNAFHHLKMRIIKDMVSYNSISLPIYRPLRGAIQPGKPLIGFSVSGFSSYTNGIARGSSTLRMASSEMSSSCLIILLKLFSWPTISKRFPCRSWGTMTSFQKALVLLVTSFNDSLSGMSSPLMPRTYSTSEGILRQQACIT